MTDITPGIAATHAVYCNITDRALLMTSRHLWAWEIWKAKGFTEDDLRLVVRHIKNLIKLNRRRPESFRFHLLVEDTDRFAEDLAEARAAARTPKTDYGRREVLKATGRATVSNENKTRTAAEIMAGNVAFKEFLKLKETL